VIAFHRESVPNILGRESVHPFPARMAPGLALEVMAETRKSLIVLDPMAGSGTVLAVARSCGHRAIGIDLDPLSVLISKVWTTTVDVARVRNVGAAVLRRARMAFGALRCRDAYPRGADSETRRFVAYWFDDYSRRQLASLALAISRAHDNRTRDALWCAFSRLIIAKQAGASRAMDLPHSRPHRVFDRAPAKPFAQFEAAVERVLEGCIDARHRNRGPATRVELGDARALSLADASVDLVLTSPPYLNAIDYFRCSKFSLVWMGYTIDALRRLRSAAVGTEVGKPEARSDDTVAEIIRDLRLRPTLKDRDEAILARYIDDMKRVLKEATRVLVRGGKVVCVVGENTIRGTYIRNAEIVTALAEAGGLKLRVRRVRTLPANRRYLPPPRRAANSEGLDARMRREVVLAFERPA
jgi:hypothetical protein